MSHTPDRIYGGTNAEDGEFPHQLSCHYTYIVNFGHICGASLLTTTKALSAAHCQTEVPGNGRYTLYAGLTNFDRTEYQQAIEAASYVLHPDYRGGVNPYDIMIVSIN